MAGPNICLMDDFVLFSNLLTTNHRSRISRVFLSPRRFSVTRTISYGIITDGYFQLFIISIIKVFITLFDLPVNAFDNSRCQGRCKRLFVWNDTNSLIGSEQSCLSVLTPY